jgi:hypothetical protein
MRALTLSPGAGGVTNARNKLDASDSMLTQRSRNGVGISRFKEFLHALLVGMEINDAFNPGLNSWTSRACQGCASQNDYEFAITQRARRRSAGRV